MKLVFEALQMYILCTVPPRSVTHHDREDDGGHGGLEDPQQGQAERLNEGEEVDAALRDMPQVDEVGLVLGGHQQQLQAVHELTWKRYNSR